MHTLSILFLLTLFFFSLSLSLSSSLYLSFSLYFYHSLFYTFSLLKLPSNFLAPSFSLSLSLSLSYFRTYGCFRSCFSCYFFVSLFIIFPFFLQLTISLSSSPSWCFVYSQRLNNSRKKGIKCGHKKFRFSNHI